MTPEFIVSTFVCPVCAGRLVAHVFKSSADDIIDGEAVCTGCGAPYRIENGIAELLPLRLQDGVKGETFKSRYGDAVGERGTRRSEPCRPDDIHKLEQKSFYDEDAIPYETSMLRLPFWQAFDRTFRERLLGHAGGTLLEIGCGTGRISLPCRSHFKSIIGFDISESMVSTAMSKRADLPDAKHIEYFVADAENIPVNDSVADMVVFSGILHHVENPSRVIAEALRALKPGGSYWGLENNRSAMRPMFDFLMKWSKLWNEKAHKDHFIMSDGEVSRWLSEAGADIASMEVWTSVFLPPHVFNHFRPKTAELLLVNSDALAQRIPWLRKQGGLLLFSGHKR